MTTPTQWKEFEHEHRTLIAVAEACHRNDSQSWHVFEWMAWKLRCKYPLVRKQDQIICDLDCIT